ncbi:MAG: hypothetical protein ACK5YX_18585, partial [Planctomyces sp.]
VCVSLASSREAVPWRVLKGSDDCWWDGVSGWVAPTPPAPLPPRGRGEECVMGVGRVCFLGVFASSREAVLWRVLEGSDDC